ncbi:MAG: TldD/PmbA family protein [Clostridia bacterium]|jgi:PmbA protein|nr:TldD/PmbA family protein [Clostridia bacterium]MDH7572645.1 TldD/PmbA family protein [Clostridia bacterium]
MSGDFGREKDIVWDLVAQAQRRGARAAEAYFSEEEETGIEVRDQKVEDLKIAREQGVGLRVLMGRQPGFAYTTDLSGDGLVRLVEEALANAAAASEDPYQVLPGPAVYPENLDLYDPSLERTPPDAKVELALRLEQAGRSLDPRVRLTETASYEESRYRVVLANSNGLLAAYRGAHCGLSAVFVAAQDGDHETGFAFQYRTRYADLDPEGVGRQAASRAVEMLGARPITPRRATVVMDPYVAINFLGLLIPSFSADAVQKGRSLLADKRGRKVAGGAVTVVDDGLLPGGLASAPFDGEGVPCRRNLLLEAGIVSNFMHNSYTAARAGEETTGNAARGSFRSLPGVGTTNCYLQPGGEHPAALIRGVGSGLYLTEVLGMHTANPVSGDFSVGAAGRLIENGELTAPVRGITVAGNILEWLGAIEACGRDLTFLGSTGAPTILVGRLTVSG